MNHAILGVGGVGGLIGAVLARDGDRVTLLLRPETLDKHPDHLWLESPFGDIRAPVQRATMLKEPVDVLWIGVKAHQLDAALRAVPADASRIGTIVPLLNGIDHVALLRSRYGHQCVVPGTIAVEAERVAPGHIIQRSPFVRLALSVQGERQLEGVAARLRPVGFTCDFQADEQTMLWSKLAFLAPFALTSTAADKTKGEVFADPTWRERLGSAVREACAVAVAEGAAVDGAKILATLESLPATMRSSMQKDVAAGRMPELDAIGGPIVRGGLKYGVEVPVTRDLAARIEDRLKKRAGVVPRSGVQFLTWCAVISCSSLGVTHGRHECAHTLEKGNDRNDRARTRREGRRDRTETFTRRGVGLVPKFLEAWVGV